MEPEAAPTLTESESGQVVATDDSPRTDIVRCGAELVELSERFYRGLFVGVLVFVGLAALAALALLPLRQPAGEGGPPVSGLVGAGLLIAAAPLAVWHSASLYRALRRYTRLELVLALVAAALVVVVHPLHSQLWWPSCAILIMLAVVVPLRRALAYCLLVLTANLLAHVLAGDLGNTPPVTIIGLWIGYPFWVSTVAAITEHMAAHLLRLNATEAAPGPAPRRVATWTSEDGGTAQDVRSDEPTNRVLGAPRANGRESSDSGAQSSAPANSVGPSGDVERLTARQLQVVALLADGLRYRDVAACLSVSEGQVQRHVARAVARLGVRSTNELVAAAVAGGLVPPLPA